MADVTTNDGLAQDVAEAPSRVMPLSEVDDFEVADGYPEIRGWDVRDSGGRSIGYVYDVLVDLEEMRVRYLDVELDPEFAGSSADQRVLIPLESVDLDGGREEVVLEGIDAEDVHTLVPYARRGVAREESVPLTPTAAGFADVGLSTPIAVDAELPRERHYDDERLFARESVPAPAVPALDALLAPETTGSERLVDTAPSRGRESASLAASEMSLADVAVHKTIQTDRVHERVKVDREEVEVERRALRPGEELRAPDVRGDEIHIPIMAEELVVEKRMVTKEVLVIRKRRVAEERTVEADLRREDVRVGGARGDAEPVGNIGDQPPLDRVRTLGETAGGPEGRV